MARSVYVAAMAPASGRSVAVLGLMEALTARAERVGYFRPVVAAPGADRATELVRRRYRLEGDPADMAAASLEEARTALADGRGDELATRVLEAYRRLAERCDVVVCEGLDVAEASGLHLDLDAELANQIGAPVLAVVRAARPGEEEQAVRLAREALEQRRCSVFGVLVNRVPAADASAVAERLRSDADGEAVWALPEDPELARPTVRDVAAALGARLRFRPELARQASWAGASVAMAPTSEDLLQREVRDVRVAAMNVEHFIDDLIDGALVIVPGDRPDILVSCITSTLSSAFPTVAGVVLTGGYDLHPSVARLLQSAPFAILECEAPMHAAAAAAVTARAEIAPGDERRIARALAVFEAGVTRAELQERLALERPVRMTPLMFEYELLERARAERCRIVLPEGDDERVLRAAEILTRRGVVDITLLGGEEEVRARAATLGLDMGGVEVVDPATSPSRLVYAEEYFQLRKHKGVTEDLAFETVGAPSYFATMMVRNGEADGMVSGAVHTTADTIRPAFELIRASRDVAVVSSVFFMCLPDRVLVYGDCAVNPHPDSKMLADIAIVSAGTAATFGVEPRIAMLSYSTGESGRGPAVTAVRQATELVRERRPDLLVEGPIQYDAAIDPHVARTKLPDSEVAGRATVFIFPDLETGNIAYKAVQRSSGALAVGPVLQGLRKPVNDLSRGCNVPDIVNTVAITAVQAQEIRRRADSVSAESTQPAPAG